MQRKRELQFLEPSPYSPNEINMLAREIWCHFRDHNWEIPGYSVLFDVYGLGSSSSVEKVKEIRGKNFIIGFGGIQGEVNWPLANTAGFNFIAVPNFIIEFYADGSGPTIYKYTGNRWEESITQMYASWFSVSDKPDWTGQLIKDEFIKQAISFLKENVIPKIKENNVKKNIDSKSVAKVESEPSKNNDANNAAIPESLKNEKFYSTNKILFTPKKQETVNASISKSERKKSNKCSVM